MRVPFIPGIPRGDCMYLLNQSPRYTCAWAFISHVRNRLKENTAPTDSCMDVQETALCIYRSLHPEPEEVEA